MECAECLKYLEDKTSMEKLNCKIFIGARMPGLRSLCKMTYKSIFTAGVARYLLKLGNQIYDIKPDKRNINKTIFIFEETEKFKQDMASVEKH